MRGLLISVRVKFPNSSWTLRNCAEFGIKPEILDSLMRDLEIIRPPGKKIVSDYSKTIKRVNIIYLNDKMYCGSYLGLKQSISWLK